MFFFTMLYFIAIHKLIGNNFLSKDTLCTKYFNCKLTRTYIKYYNTTNAKQVTFDY